MSAVPTVWGLFFTLYRAYDDWKPVLMAVSRFLRAQIIQIFNQRVDSGMVKFLTNFCECSLKTPSTVGITRFISEQWHGKKIVWIGIGCKLASVHCNQHVCVDLHRLRMQPCNLTSSLGSKSHLEFLQYKAKLQEWIKTWHSWFVQLYMQFWKMLSNVFPLSSESTEPKSRDSKGTYWGTSHLC